MLTYGGVPLAQPLPETIDWVENNISLKDIIEFASREWSTNSTFPNRLSASWLPGPADKLIKLNTLFWPRGASRFACFHGIVTDTMLATIRPLAFVPTHNPQPLFMSDGLGNSIITKLWMLPVRPLAQIAGANGMYLMTLVDDRLLWWERASAINVTATTTWAQLYAQIGTALNVTITPDTINANYLNPSVDISSQYEWLPLLLDAVAVSVGQRLIRGLDGTVFTQNARTALASVNNQIANTSKIAGGTFAVTTTNAQDLPGLAPSSVTVVFPQKDFGTFGGNFYVVQESLSSLALPEYGSVVGRVGTQLVHSSAAALNQ